MTSVAFVAFLVGHGLVHLGFVSPRPQPAAGAPPWPFELDRSWLTARGLDPGLVRALGVALLVALLLAYGLAALGILGLVAATTIIPALVAGTIASLALLVGAFHRWLLVGVAIDVVLLAATFAGWIPEVLA